MKVLTELFCLGSEILSAAIPLLILNQNSNLPIHRLLLFFPFSFSSLYSFRFSFHIVKFALCCSSHGTSILANLYIYAYSILLQISLHILSSAFYKIDMPRKSTIFFQLMLFSHLSALVSFHFLVHLVDLYA